MNFQVEYDVQPQDFLKKLDKHHAERLIQKTESVLSSTPVPHNAIAIIGEHGVFRIRIGDWRVIYRINYSAHKIIVIKIGKRSKVYQ